MGHLSDSLLDATSGAEKEAWDVRERRYVAGLGDAPREVLEVSVADKVHNVEDILDDYGRLGPTPGRSSESSAPSASSGTTRASLRCSATASPTTHSPDASAAV